MTIDKDKWAFQETLKGNKIARDRFGTPMIKGEIIAYAISRNSSAILKVGKIVDILFTPITRWGGTGSIEDLNITLTVHGAEKSHNGGWKLSGKTSRFSSIHNAIVLTNPKPEIIDLFKDI